MNNPCRICHGSKYMILVYPHWGPCSICKPSIEELKKIPLLENSDCIAPQPKYRWILEDIKLGKTIDDDVTPFKISVTVLAGGWLSHDDASKALKDMDDLIYINRLLDKIPKERVKVIYE